MFLSILLIVASFVAMQAQRDFRPPSARPCPATEAFLHDGFFYQFFDCPMTWNHAEETCNSNMVINGRSVLGGHLVSISSQEESDWLKFQLEMRYGTAVGIWIGMKRPRHRRTRCPDPVKWTDGSDVSFTNYLDEQPNCRWPDEDCFHIIDNERWNDAECEVPMRFVCKVQSTDSSPTDQITAFPTKVSTEATTISEVEPNPTTTRELPIESITESDEPPRPTRVHERTTVKTARPKTPEIPGDESGKHEDPDAGDPGKPPVPKP